MPNGATSFPEFETSKKVVAISCIAFLLGVVGLFFSNSLASWYPQYKTVLFAAEILHYSMEILASVGLIGLILERFARRQLTKEVEQRIRALFRMDREVADALSPEARRQIVKTTLTAHLGDELGPAIFNGAVLRYLEDKHANRRDARYHVTLREMQTDRRVTCGEITRTFSASEYFEITAVYRFERMVSKTKSKVVCVFDDEWSRLIDEFKASDCLLRESLPLCSDNLGDLFEALRKKPNQVNSLCTLEVSLGGQRMNVISTSVHHRSVVFDIDLGAVSVDTPIRHRIQIESIIAKAARSFPILVVEPTSKPDFEFSFPPGLQVVPRHFFTGAKPFEPSISNTPGNISIETNSNSSEEAWVFPNGGVLFTWDYSVPTSAHQQKIVQIEPDIDLIPD